MGAASARPATGGARVEARGQVGSHARRRQQRRGGHGALPHQRRGKVGQRERGTGVQETGRTVDSAKKKCAESHSVQCNETTTQAKKTSRRLQKRGRREHPSVTTDATIVMTSARANEHAAQNTTSNPNTKAACGGAGRSDCDRCRGGRRSGVATDCNNWDGVRRDQGYKRLLAQRQHACVQEGACWQTLSAHPNSAAPSWTGRRRGWPAWAPGPKIVSGRWGCHPLPSSVANVSGSTRLQRRGSFPLSKPATGQGRNPA